MYLGSSTPKPSNHPEGASLTVQASERGSGQSLPFRAGWDPLHLNLSLWLGVRGMLPLGGGQIPCIQEETLPLLSSPWEVPPDTDQLPGTWDEPELPPCPQSQVQSGTNSCHCCAPPMGTPQGTPHPITPTAPAGPHHCPQLSTLSPCQPTPSPPCLHRARLPIARWGPELLAHI